MRGTIRFRLTLWYFLTSSAILLSFSFISYALMSHNIYKQLDELLTAQSINKSKELADELIESKAAPGGHFDFVPSYGFYTALVSDGRVIESDVPSEILKRIKKRPGIYGLGGKKPFLFTIDAPRRENMRVAVTHFAVNSAQYAVITVKAGRDIPEQLENIRNVFLVCIPLALLAASFGGYFLAGKSLKPVVDMAEQARDIGAKNLHTRLYVQNRNDELGRLAGVLNEMLDRIDSAFGNMTAFMADSSHELRTPVAIIEGETDVALSKDRGSEEYRESLSIVNGEAKRLSRIVNDMRLLSSHDAGERQTFPSSFYINELIDGCGRAAKTLALEKKLRLSVNNTGDIRMYGDEHLIRQMVMNLLDNAVRHTPENGTVTLSLKPVDKERVEIIVEDTGDGIAGEHKDRIFERFYRVDKGRSRKHGGSGLGLAIAKFAVESHGGSIDVESKPGHGSRFTVKMPLEYKPPDVLGHKD